MAKSKNSNLNPTIINKLHTDPDFVYLNRYDCSLKRVIERYPEGAPNHIIANGLLIAEDEVEALYKEIVLKLRSSLSIVTD